MTWKSVAEAAAPTVAAALMAFPGACVTGARPLEDWQFRVPPEKWLETIERNIAEYRNAERIASPENRPPLRDMLGYWQVQWARHALRDIAVTDETDRHIVRAFLQGCEEKGTAYRMSEKMAAKLRQIISDWKRFGADASPAIEADEE